MPKDVSSIVGSQRSLGESESRAQDSSSIMGEAGKEPSVRKPVKKGDVYVDTLEDGRKWFYPAKHFEAGITIGFPTEAEARAANNMSEEELRRRVQSEPSDSEVMAPGEGTSAMQELSKRYGRQ
jgi:hypothetical protein